MTKVNSFPEATIESLAKALGECGSGTDITRVLQNRGIEDNSGESTKWRRLYRVFLYTQQQYHCADKVIDFVQSFLMPTRFVGRNDEFEKHRQAINSVFLHHGLEYGADGKFRKCDAVQTIGEAEKRLKTIETKLKGRHIHPEVLKYCRAELMQNNYFHAVFEATKGLAQRIREQSGSTDDGAILINSVFSIERPILAFSALQTETEKSEHKGFSSLLKGCFSAIRNPLAHEPKIHWEGGDNAADYLSLISLLHRKLDDCVRTNVQVNDE